MPGPGARPVFIGLYDVHKRFGRKHVLRGVTLEVRLGETVVVMGGSGTGKSVTLRHMVGLTPPDRGVVTVDGEEIQDLSEARLVPVRRKVAYLFQSGALFDSMDVADNIAFPLRQALWDDERIAARVPEVLQMVDLPASVAAQDPSSLSGGMRKRVALARAIAVEPRAILYDEPTTGLDPVTSGTINNLILTLQEKLRATSVVVTHDINTAFTVADRIAFLHEGRTRFFGTADEARSSTDPVLASFLEGG